MSLVSIYLLLLMFLQGIPAKVYQVKKIDQEIDITGKGIDPIWNNAVLLTDFQLPWNEEIPQPTSFRALWTDESLYLLYNVIDLDIVAPPEPKDKRGVLPSDRVEIFFKAGGEMSPYYCLELDPRARVLDYQASYYRNSNFDWYWPEDQLKVLATTTTDGYTVEARISMESLRNLAILNEDQSMDAGLFRGDFFSVNQRKSDVKWISWVKPDSEKPDFHIPSAFGKLQLVEY